MTLQVTTLISGLALLLLILVLRRRLGGRTRTVREPPERPEVGNEPDQ